MKIAGRTRSVSTAVIVLAVFLISVTQWIEETPASAAGQQLFSPVAKVRQQPLDVFVTAGAELDASQSVLISSPLPTNRGKFVYLVPEGEFVQAGDTLARFDPGPFEQELKRIEHDIRDHEIKLEQAKVDNSLYLTTSEDRLADLEQKLTLAELKNANLQEGSVPLREAQAEKEVRRAKADHDKAARVLATEEQLYEQGLTREKTVEEARVREEDARATLNLAKHSLRVLTQVTLPSELEQARLQLEKSRREITVYRKTYEDRGRKQQASMAQIENKLAALNDELRQNREHLAATELRAPVSGIVLYKPLSMQNEKRKVQVGDSVWYRQGFAVIPDMSSMVATMAVNEAEVGKLHQGQPVTLKPEAYPNTQLRGHVHSVGTLAANESSTAQRFFDVRIALDTQDERLRPGMSARASVLVSSADQATVIPVDAVFYEDLSPVVFLWRDGDPLRIPVVLGAGDAQYVQVTEGLTPEQKVMLVYPDSFEIAAVD